MPRWPIVLALLGGCFIQDRLDREERRKRELEEHIQRKAEEMQAKKIAEDAKRYDEDQAKVAQAKENRDLDKAMDKARAEDAVALKAKRGPFAAKIKAEAGCASAVVEGPEQDTLHTEGCTSFGAPAASPELFREAQTLGFVRIHNHSIGRAWCSYYLQNFPTQKTWKCNPTGGSWPGR